MLRSIKNVHPRRGKTQLFLLYKIGYDVETPSTTFGIDIFHPRASKFADKLNFLLISTTAVTTILNLFRNPKEQRHPITSNFVDTFASLLGGRTFTFWGNLNKDKVLQTQQAPRKICPCIWNWLRKIRRQCDYTLFGRRLLQLSGAPGRHPTHLYPPCGWIGH